MPGQRIPEPWASPEVVDQILRIGREQSPAEACGIVTPDLRVVVLPNRHPTSTRDSFVIEAKDLVDSVMAYMERTGVKPHELTRGHFLVWHTHPGGQVGPSQGDLDNRVEGFQNMVVTLPDGPATIY